MDLIDYHPSSTCSSSTPAYDLAPSAKKRKELTRDQVWLCSATNSNFRRRWLRNSGTARRNGRATRKMALTRASAGQHVVAAESLRRLRLRAGFT